MPAMHASDFKPNQAGEPNGPRRGGWRRCLLLSLAACIFIVCCGLAYGAGCFLAEWRNAQRAAALRDDQDATQLGPLAVALPYAGQWAFDDLDWSVKSQMIAAKDLDAEFARLGDTAKTINDSLLPETDPELVGLIAAFGMTPVERGGDKVYRVEKPDLKAELVARDVAGKTRTVTFAAAYPAAEGKWQLFAFTPRTDASTESSNNVPHLLPLPTGATRSGGRYDDAGQLIMEFVSLDTTADELTKSWKAAGWEVRPSGFGDGHEFSFLCGRGAEMIYAWSADPANSLKNLMLVRSPAAADTNP